MSIKTKSEYVIEALRDRYGATKGQGAVERDSPIRYK
jgi:hypothetical protein